jgi:iron complex outermembrane receptor protein
MRNSAAAATFLAFRPTGLVAGYSIADAKWFARASVLHAFEQNRFSVEFEEEATPGYTLASAEISYTSRFAGVGGLSQEVTIWLKRENLADDEVLNHASFKRREDVLLPGANVRLFGSIKLN